MVAPFHSFPAKKTLSLALVASMAGISEKNRPPVLLDILLGARMTDDLGVVMEIPPDIAFSRLLTTAAETMAQRGGIGR